MLNGLIKGVLSAITLKLIDNYRHISIKLLRIESAKSYLRGVQMVRLSAMVLIRMGLVIALVSIGVLLFHICLFIILPITLQAKAWLGLFLGLVYIISGGVAIRLAMDEGAWMEKSGASDLVKDAIRPVAKD